MKLLFPLLFLILNSGLNLGCAARFTAAGDLSNLNSNFEAVDKSCSTYARQTLVQNISFPRETNGCEWSTNGNDGFHDLHFQARREQLQSLSLPPGATICSMKLTTDSTDFYYDDEFILDFKGLVLASSMDFSNRLERRGRYLTYDWSLLRSQPWSNFSSAAYCAGADRGLGYCSWPDTSTNGPLILDFDDQVIREMSLAGNSNFRFRMTVTGDNDDSVDCRHNQVDFQVEVSYIQ